MEELLSQLGLSAGFNGVAGAKNTVELARYQQTLGRIQTAKDELDQRNAELIDTQQQITDVERELAQTNEDIANARAALPKDAPDTPEIIKDVNKAKRLSDRDKSLGAQRDAINGRITALSTEITGLNTSLGTLGISDTNILGSGAASAGAGTAGGTAGSGGATPPQGIYASLPDKIKNSDPSLAPSIALENYINMQYEVIAKQITLLRDAAGPDSKIVFVEVPCSIYLDARTAKRSLVQVRWQISGYIYAPDNDRDPAGLAEAAGTAPAQRIGDRGAIMARAASVDVFPGPPPPIAQPTDEKTAATTQQYRFDKDSGTAPDGRPPDIDRGGSELARPQGRRLTPDLRAKFEVANVRTNPLAGGALRVVDVIPRQSALNVAEIHHTSKGFALAGKFLAAFGMGAEIDYSRQRDKYSSFQQQQVFASGFGKGSRTFGWTFGPVPGTDSIAPGVRTTYAVIAVPKDAVALKLCGSAAVFDRSAQPPPLVDCAKDTGAYQATLWLADPLENGIYVNSIDYTQVKSGETATLILRGNFSPQIGVSIKGTSVAREVALTDTDWLNQLPSAVPLGPGDGPAGRFELVNPETLVVQFRMPPTYEGTPIILLETPSYSAILNRLEIPWINYDKSDISLAEYTQQWPMFIRRLAIEDARLVHTGEDAPNDAVLEITGSGFRADADFQVGAVPLTGYAPQDTAANVILPSLPNHSALLADAVDQSGNQLGATTRQRAALEAGPPAAGRGTQRRLFLVPDSILTEEEWRVTVTQTTKEGVETVTRPIRNLLIPSVTGYEILNYVAPANGRAGRIDVQIAFSPAPDNAKPSVLDPGMGSIHDWKPLGNGSFWVQIDAKSDPVLLMFSSAKAGVSRIVAITPPLRPHVRSIENAQSGGPSGPAAGGYYVTVRGDYLGRVRRVFFGTKQSPSVQISAGALNVLVPAGEAGNVPVRLETDIVYQGETMTNAGDFSSEKPPMFTYLAAAKSGTTP